MRGGLSMGGRNFGEICGERADESFLLREGMPGLVKYAVASPGLPGLYSQLCKATYRRT